MLHPEQGYSRKLTRHRRRRAEIRAKGTEIAVAGKGLEQQGWAKQELKKVIDPLHEIATELRERHADQLRNPGGINQVDLLTVAQIASGLGHIASILQQQIAAQYDNTPFNLDHTAGVLDKIADLLQHAAVSDALTRVLDRRSERRIIIKIENPEDRVSASLGKIRDVTKPAPFILSDSGIFIGRAFPTLAQGLYLGDFGNGEIIALFAAHPDEMQSEAVTWEQKPPIFPTLNALGK